MKFRQKAAQSAAKLLRFIRVYLAINFVLGLCPQLPGTVSIASAQEYRLSAVFTAPDCSTKKGPSTWCSSGHFQRNYSRQRIPDKLFPEGPLNKIYGASFSFGGTELTEILCRHFKEDAEINLVVDRAQKETKKNRPLLENCGLKHRKINYYYLGASGKWPNWINQHIKLWLFEPKNGEQLHIVFGNGNFTDASFSYTYNSWIKVDAPRSSDFARHSRCIFDALLLAAKDETAKSKSAKAKELFSESVRACRKKNSLLDFEHSLAKNKIAISLPLLSEDKTEAKFIELIKKLGKEDELLVASQVFTNKEILEAMARAKKRGVKVKLLLDDDNLSGAFNTQNGRDFYYKNIKKSGIETKFLDTNHKIKQLMHLKFILSKEWLITGSGQFTYAAFHNNYENFYVISERSLIESHRSEFYRLWELAQAADA